MPPCLIFDQKPTLRVEFHKWLHLDRLQLGSAKSYRGEPKSCLGRVFNSKLDRIVILRSKCMLSMQPLLQLKLGTGLVLSAKVCPCSSPAIKYQPRLKVADCSKHPSLQRNTATIITTLKSFIVQVVVIVGVISVEKP